MAAPLVMPKLGMIMTEGTVAQWLKKQGQRAQQGEPVVAVETDKSSFDVEAPQEGEVFPVVPEGQVVPVDTVIGYVLAPGEAPPPVPPPAPSPASAAAAQPAAGQAAAPALSAEGELRASPLARRLAQELGIDIARVPGTGPRGRVTQDDVRAYAEKVARASPAQAAPPPAALQMPVRSVVPLRGVRKVIAERMGQSLQNAAQFTLTLEVDVTDLVNWRRQRAQGASGPAAPRTTTTDVVIKAVAEVLKSHPRLNATIVGAEIHELAEINVGFAVALKEGLIVPVVRNADKKTLAELAGETAALKDKAVKGALMPDDTAGGTFTVSVLGQVDAFTPILNPPQVAILGAGRVVQKPAIYEGEIARRWMTVLSLTVDHRAVDGEPAASFLRRVAQLLSTPAMLKGLLS